MTTDFGPTSYNQNQPIFTDGTGFFGLYARSTGPKLQAGFHDETTGHNAVESASFTLGQPVIVGVRFGSGSVAIRLNNVSENSLSR